jgi:hypothetical protein
MIDKNILNIILKEFKIEFIYNDYYKNDYFGNYEIINIETFEAGVLYVYIKKFWDNLYNKYNRYQLKATKRNEKKNTLIIHMAVNKENITIRIFCTGIVDILGCSSYEVAMEIYGYITQVIKKFLYDIDEPPLVTYSSFII